MWELLKIYKKNEFTTHFEQKFTTCSFDVLSIVGQLLKYAIL
jgi:hypothetical protein